MKLFKKIITLLIACCYSGLSFAAGAKPLVLATEATYPPFESINSQGQMIGFDVDILNAICNANQLSCKFINQPWDSLIPGLALGKFDVIFGAMNITDERRKQVDFTEPYYISTGSFVAAKNANLSLDPNSLKGKTIGVQGSTTYEYYLQATYGNSIHINRYGSIQDAFLDLQSGRIDAVFGDTPIVLSWLNTSKNSVNYAQVGKPVQDPKYFSQGYGFAVKKGNTVLLNQLNSGLKTIKANGAYTNILQKYFGTGQ